MTEAIQKIGEQQKRYDETQHGYWLCEQLKEICRDDRRAAELVARDLDNPEMGVDACVKKLDAWAEAHKRGNRAVVPPTEAERILREFYGLPEKDAAHTAVSLLDLME